MDDLHIEVEIKPQLKPRSSVAKEDPKPFHQLYKLQIKFHIITKSDSVSLEYIKGH